jgi:hypothetical protein
MEYQVSIGGFKKALADGQPAVAQQRTPAGKDVHGGQRVAAQDE